MSDIVERLRKVADNSERWDGPALTSWDSIRHQVETMPGSDIPRMNFEALIGELAEGMREAADEIERLTAARDAAMRVHVEDGAEIERLRGLVKVLADDLEKELRGYYGPAMNYPSERRQFERDMANVYEARKALEGK